MINDQEVKSNSVRPDFSSLFAIFIMSNIIGNDRCFQNVIRTKLSFWTNLRMINHGIVNGIYPSSALNKKTLYLI